MMLDRYEMARHGRRKRWSLEYTGYWIEHAYCEVCGRPAEPPHHIQTRGAGGGDEPDNLMSLCLLHHREIHDHGIETFAHDHPKVAKRLERWSA